MLIAFFNKSWQMLLAFVQVNGEPIGNQAIFSKLHVPKKNCTDKKYSFEQNFT